MGRYLLTALRMAFFTLVLVGVIYPLLVTGLGQLLFPRQANGSLIRDGAMIRGSSLIGQSFTEPEYFYARPSAVGYDPLASGGSNLGPTSQALRDRVANEVARVRTDNPDVTAVPADMVTTSASGLDPDITPAAAYDQVARVARARGVLAADIQALVDRYTMGRQLGFLGEPRVNVLHLNQAIDTTYGTPKR